RNTYRVIGSVTHYIYSTPTIYTCIYKLHTNLHSFPTRRSSDLDHPLTERQQKSNRKKSKYRARVEHIFGFMTNSMQGMYLHTVRSEEHTSELQSQSNLVCRLLLEKKKKLRLTRCHLQHYIEYVG